MTFGSFFLPGPTEVRPEILAAMTRPMISHRGDEFEAMFVRIQQRLTRVFLTQRPVFISTSSGTGMMEAAIRCAPPGRILSLVNGAFSERFANISKACGRETDRYDVDWGQVHDVEELERRLAGGKYSAITVGHSETSTGALNNVRAISDTAHRLGVYCLIDGVSSVAGAELRFDDWGLDFVLTGSQKAFALPPGLAFAVASEKYLEHGRRNPNRGVYFDLIEYEELVKKNQTPNTPAISLYYALDAQLDYILEEGIENRWARHAAMQREVIGWAERQRLRVIASERGRSPTVSAIEVPDGVKVEDLHRKLSEEQITIGTGYGKLKSKSFRIGHMGDHTVE
ncbi:MAG TPA: alanine--glyoxylate aminotransferase family protein, partial [Gemmatimonadaceae bacterium]